MLLTVYEDKRIALNCSNYYLCSFSHRLFTYFAIYFKPRTAIKQEQTLYNPTLDPITFCQSSVNKTNVLCAAA